MLPLVVSTLAPILTCIQLLPQLHKTYMTKSVKDLSIYSLFLIFFANLFWLLHGVFIFDVSLIISGLLGMIIKILLIAMYFIYR